MSKLSQLAKQLKSSVQGITAQIAEIDSQIDTKLNQIAEITNGKVTRAEFKTYLLKTFEEKANKFKRKFTSHTDKYGLNTSFECLENNKELSNVKFFTGDFTPENITEEALFYYFPEQIAERFILLLSDDYFDEQAPPKAERLKQIAQIEYEIEELKQEKGELIQTLKEAGIA